MSKVRNKDISLVVDQFSPKSSLTGKQMELRKGVVAQKSSIEIDQRHKKAMDRKITPLSKGIHIKGYV